MTDRRFLRYHMLRPEGGERSAVPLYLTDEGEEELGRIATGTGLSEVLPLSDVSVTTGPGKVLRTGEDGRLDPNAIAATAPATHATSHHSGGVDALALGSLAGTLTAGQHGTPAGDLHPSYALDADLAAHEAAADPHAVYQRESEKGAASGYASLSASTKVPIGEIPTGSTSLTVCIGDDARLSDARTPTAHAASHQNGGSDELSVAGLSGVLADPQPPIIGATGTTAVAGNDARLTDARTPTAHKTSHENGGSDELSVLGLSGLLADGQTPLAHKTSHENGGADEISVAGLSGLLADAQTPTAHTHDDRYFTEAEIAAGYQPLDADLTTIAGLTATSDNFMVAAASAWASRTPAQAKTSLALVKGDVGLGNVDNTSDANKPISTATQTALDAKQPLDSDLTTIAGLTATTDNFMVASGSAWASRTPTQARTHMGLGTAALAATGDFATAAQGVDSRAPNGSASGDLGGTYPSPTVTAARGVRETSGPTVLVVGAIADGEFLKRNGSALVGGAPGAASVNIKQTEVDFGATPVAEASFTITDADVSAGSQLIGSVAYTAPTGKDLDELDMDGLDLKFAPGDGEFTVYARGLDGYVADKFKLNYLIG